MKKILLPFYLLLAGCAQQLAPQGGPRDESPPIVLIESPQNSKTEFREEKVIIEFNEFIRLKNPQENVLISPVMKNEPDYLVKGKKLQIKISDTLKEDATYVMNFNDAIVDITEENPLSGYNYVFSTGSYVDSLEVSGFMYDPFTLQPMESVYALLYETTEDSVPYKSMPRYLAKTNEFGRFNISNIREGEYKFFALQDQNRNYLFDNPNEFVGFLDTLIKVMPDTSRKIIQLPVFKEFHQKQYLSKYGSKQHGQFYISFNLPVDSFQMKDLKGRLKNVKLIEDFNEQGDSLVFWIDPPGAIDSLQLEVRADTLIDTLNILVPEKSRKLVEVSIECNCRQGKMDLNDSIRLFFNRPVFITDSLVFLLEDSVKIELEWIKAGASGMKYVAYHDWNEESKYLLINKDSAFIDIYGGVSDSTAYNFTTKKLEDYGTLKLNINGIKNGDILQLKRGDDIIQEDIVTSGLTTFDYDFLQPGEYGVKVIDDENANGVWDTGNYLENRQPEKVTIYNEPITIRSNWDQEIDWILKSEKYKVEKGN